MPNDFLTIASFGHRDVGDATGDTPYKLFTLTGNGPRSGVEIHNGSSSLSLWLRCIRAGDPEPVIDASDRDFAIPPGQTLALAYGEQIDIWIMNSSQTSESSPFTAREVRG